MRKPNTQRSAKKHEMLINVTCRANAWLRPDELEEFQGGLKTLSEENYQKLKSSIADPKIGFSFPIFVWRNKNKNFIIDGHQRLITVRRMIKDGWILKGGKIPVDWIDAPDIKTAKKKVVLAVSQYGAYDEESFLEFLKTAEVDFNELKDLIELPQIDLEQFAIDWGKNLGQISDKSSEDDEVPPVPDVPKGKFGELWVLGRHHLLSGDSTEQKDIERLMDGKKANMVFTDPPYGVSYADKNAYLNAISRGNHIQTPMDHDHVSEKEIMRFWKASFEIIRDNLADVNSYYIFGPQIQGMMMMMMMQEAGLPYRHVIIWVKNNHVLGRCDYNYKHEPIFFGWTRTHKFYGKGEFQTSVWPVNKPLKSDLHPTMKPIAIMENALLNSSQSGQICLDPFLGSGSTLIACEKTGRICYGMEIDPHYCDVILDRWANYTGKDPVREDGTKWSELKHGAKSKRIRPKNPKGGVADHLATAR